MRRLVVALALAVASGCTHAPWHPYRGWRVYTGATVVLYTDTLKEHELAYEYLEDSFEVMQRTFFRRLPVPPLHAVYVAPNNDTPLRTAEGTKKFGAVFPRLRGATIADGQLMTVGRYAHITDYAHLVTHHFVESTMPGAPAWLHEGLALYLSVFRSHPQKPGVLCFGLRLPQQLRDQTMMDLGRLLDTSWEDYNQTSAPWVGPTGWTVVDYLLHGEGGSLRPGFQPLLLAFAGGASGAKAFATAYPNRTLAELDQGVRAHMRSWRHPGDVCPLAVPLTRAPAGIRVVGLPPAEPAAEADIRAVFQALEQLPARKGYADFYPVNR